MLLAERLEPLRDASFMSGTSPTPPGHAGRWALPLAQRPLLLCLRLAFRELRSQPYIGGSQAAADCCIAAFRNAPGVWPVSRLNTRLKAVTES